jgi:1-acyl-sn-glycerol-3-phosphate acyltransferase
MTATAPLPVFEEPARSVWERRLVTVPGVILLAALWHALLPILLPLALLRDLVVRRRFVATRFVLAVAGSFGAHVVGVIGLGLLWLVGRFVSADTRAEQMRRFEIGWARMVFGSAAWLFGMRIEVEGETPPPDRPLVLFPRHTSILDTLLPMILIGGPQRRHLRHVMKRELLWDPVLDIVGHREPTAFVRRGTRKHGSEIEAVAHLMDRLGDHDAVVIWPEGTRFSPEKRARVLASLAEKDPALHARAERLRHTLPPRLGGPLALLERGVDADVVFCAHTGLEGANHLVDLAEGTLVGQTIRVQFWRVPAQDIPTEHEARVEWLFEWWQRVDDWVEAHRQGAPQAG